MLRRLVETNMDETLGYGADPYCQSATERIREACGSPDARVYFLTGGTQVNATVMYAVLRHCQGVISPVTGHINHHESGAVEATGHKVIALSGHDGGKLNVPEVRDYLKAYRADENYAHIVEPGMVYITHPTELGALAYALASDKTDITLKDIASLCDIFYIGGTKCGALFGEALVIHPGLTGELFSIIKQRGAMLAKGRLLGLQFDTLFTDGLYERNGRNAIGTAEMLADGLKAKGYSFLIPPQTNQLFVIMDNAGIGQLRKEVSFSLWEHVDADRSAIRLVTDWATPKADIEALLTLL